MRDPRTLSSDELLGLVSAARWFAAKGRVAEGAEVVGLPVEDGPVVLAIVEIRFTSGTHEHYLLAFGEGDEAVDAFERPEVAARLASLAGVPAEGARVRPLGVEQSNSSVVLDELHVLKLYRRLEAGPNPELELLRALAARRFENAPRLEGALETPGPAARDGARVGHRARPLGGRRLGADARLVRGRPVLAPRARLAPRRGHRRAARRPRRARLRPALRPGGAERRGPRPARRRDRGGDRDDVRHVARGRRPRRGRPPLRGPPRPRPGARRGRPLGARDPDARRLPPRPGALDGPTATGS